MSAEKAVIRRGVHTIPECSLTWKRRVTDVLRDEYVIPPGFDGEIVMVLKGGGVARARITREV